jgi:hypothetical protein
MGYERREYKLGGKPVQAATPIVITKGDSWIEEHYITLPPFGLFSSSDSVDNVIVHVRNREDDAEPQLEGTSSPAAGVTVSRPSPDLLIVRWEFSPADTLALELTAPDGGRIPGTPAPPQTVPGVGLTAAKVYFGTGQEFTFFRGQTVSQPALVF